MTPASDKPHHSQTVAIVLTVVVGVIATVVAYLGTREGTQAPAARPAVATGATLPVDMIVLPHDEPELPSGPYQRQFATSCTICHSPRLVMTQPPFPRKQWAEVVAKMVKTYGAPITPEGQEQIVDYLTTIRGK